MSRIPQAHIDRAVKISNALWPRGRDPSVVVQYFECPCGTRIEFRRWTVGGIRQLQRRMERAMSRARVRHSQGCRRRFTGITSSGSSVRP